MKNPGLCNHGQSQAGIRSFVSVFSAFLVFFNFSIFQFFAKNKGNNIFLSPKQTFSIKLFLFCDLYGLQKTRVWHWCGMMQQEMQVLKGFGGQPPVFTDCSSQDIIRIGTICGREICMPKCTYPHWYTTIFFDTSLQISQIDQKRCKYQLNYQKRRSWG